MRPSLPARGPIEYIQDQVSDIVHTYGRKAIVYTVMGAGIVGPLWGTTEEPIVEPMAKMLGEIPYHALGMAAPWENDGNKKVTTQQAGTIMLKSYFGQFARATEARARFRTEIFGRELNASEATRQGIIVSRLEMPGVAALHYQEDEDVQYITMMEDGQDVGIPLDRVRFSMLHPETATIIDGEFRCQHEFGDPEYSGCIEGETTDMSITANLPIIGEDQGNDLQIAAEIVMDEFGQIEKCDFDNIIIPKFNETYERFGMSRRIDGTSGSMYSEAMATMLRYFIRTQFAASIPPQRTFFHFSGEFVPTESVVDRLEERAKAVDFPLEPPEDLSRRYCATGPDGIIPLTVMDGDNLGVMLERMAIGGMETVPAGYNIATHSFEEGKFAAANMETSLGTKILTLLEGN